MKPLNKLSNYFNKLWNKIFNNVNIIEPSDPPKPTNNVNIIEPSDPPKPTKP